MTSLSERVAALLRPSNDAARTTALTLGFLGLMLVSVFAFPSRPPGAILALGGVGGLALALQAIGLLLVYQTDGIINFAQVQIGAVGATFFVLFARYMPVPTKIHEICPSCIEQVTPGLYRWNFVAAAVLGILISVLVAWLFSTMVVRRFAKGPRLIATVATLFLVPVLGLVQRAMSSWLVTQEQREIAGGAASLGAPDLPGRFSFRWGPALFGVPQILTLGVAVVAIGAVWWFLRHTASGASLRAVADNPDRASTLGFDVQRIKNRAWMIAGALSAAAAIVASMSEGADPAGALGVATTVRLLAIAVAARMTSLPIAIFAALALGIFENSLDWSFSAASLLDALLLVVIAVVLIVQRRGVTRAEREREAGIRFGREIRPIPAELRGHPSVRTWTRFGAIALGIAALAFPWVMSPSELSLGTVALLLAMVGLSVLVLTGWAGQISLGQMAFAAIGAYVAAVTRAPFPIPVIAGALAGGAAALLVGLPALRLRGMYLAVTTLAFSLATTTTLLDEQRLGRFLPSTLRRPGFLGLSDDRVFYYVVLAILALAVFAVFGMRHSRFARALIAGRDNEPAAEAYGIVLVRARLGAFAASGALAALAGALLAFQQFGVRPATYSAEQSLNVFLWSVIGGLGAITGPLLGAAFHGIVDVFSNNQVVQFLAGGVGGLLLLIMVPGGLARIVFGMRDAMLRRLAQRNRIVVPSLLADVGVSGDERIPISARHGRTIPAPRYTLDDQWAYVSNGDAREEEPSRG